MRLFRDQEKSVDELDDLDTDVLDGDDDYLSDDLGDDFLGDTGQTPLEKHNDLLKSLTNFEPFIKDAINNWLGLMWSEEEGKFVRNKLIDPIMNIKGATWCAGLLKTYTRGNNIITDIRSEEYRNMMGDHIEAIWLNLGTRDDLGVKSTGDLIRVANELEHAAALVLMGAGDGKYNKMLGTTYTSHTNSTPDNSYKSQGVAIKRPGLIEDIRRKLLSG